MMKTHDCLAFVVCALLLGCGSSETDDSSEPKVVREDSFAQAASQLASRIPGDSRAALAEPIIDVFHPFDGYDADVKKELSTRSKGYAVRLEGALSEAFRRAAQARRMGVLDREEPEAKILTRVHLEPVLEEANLKWAPLSQDSASRAKLAALTEVNTLITWNITAEEPLADKVRVFGSKTRWTYREQWTLQAIRIDSGEILGSVTILRSQRQRLGS